MADFAAFQAAYHAAMASTDPLARFRSLMAQQGLVAPPPAAVPGAAAAPVPPAAPAPQAAPAPAAPAAAAPAPTEEPVVEIEDDRTLGTEEAEEGKFAAYRALAVRERYPEIMGHPDPLVETASLASVPLPPADYEHSLHDCIAKKTLSDAQLETVIYANRKFSGPTLADGKRSGFFLGDGAGVGKGRQIAALIRQHWSEGGRHILWVSVSNDLKHDAQRDLNDIDAAIAVYPQGNSLMPGKGQKLPYTGVLFVTYSLLISGLGGQKADAAFAKNLEEEAGDGNPNAAGPSRRRKNMDDYSNLRINVPASSRLAQIIAWLKRCPHGPLVVFDECHRAKNLIPCGGGQPSQTARAVVELQEQLPSAKVLYSSATGASEPRNLAYMTRLGMWGFKDAKEMIELLSKSKLGALELAAMSMKASGTYLSRTLSYEGAEFALAYVDIDKTFLTIFERACMFWNLLWKVVVAHPKLKKLQGVFWSAHQRFFKQMLMACKVAACAQMAQDAITEGHCAVIGLQSTGEANTNTARDLLEADGGDFDDLISAPRLIIETYIRNQFPIQKGGMTNEDMDELEFQVFAAVEQWRSMLPAAEVNDDVADADRTATLMGMNVHTRDHHGEEDIIRMRNAARVMEEQDKAAKEAARVAEWKEKQAKREQELRADREMAIAALAKEEQSVRVLEGQVAAAAAAVAQVKAEKGASPALPKAQTIIISDSDEDMPAAAAQQQQQAARKRKTVVDSSSEDEDEAGLGQENADAAPSRPSSAMDQHQVPLSPLSKNLAALQSASVIKMETDAGVPGIELIPARTCQVCESEGDEETLAMCDGCDEHFHLACLQLTARPDGGCFCSPTCPRLQTTSDGIETVDVKAEALAERPAAARLAAKADWSSSDSEDDGPAVKTLAGEGPARLKMKLLAARKKVDVAKRQVALADEALAALADGSKRGPPTARTREEQRQKQAAKGGAGEFKVRALSVRGASVPGFKHSVATKGLDDLPTELPDHSSESEDDDADPDFTAPDKEKKNGDISPQLLRMRGWLLRLASAMELPPNPLDHLVSLLGGEAKVAELTGRKGFVAMDADTNKAAYKQRGAEQQGSQKDLNLREKDAFMAGRKLVAIISDAASTGISLQADRRVKNQRRRVHITLELPWSADKAIQQFGRSHRANQVSAPMYRILCTPAGGEYRFASAAAKRLSSLGALLRGDRNAVGAGSELKSFDIDNAEGEQALRRVLQDVLGEEQPMPAVTVPELPEKLAEPQFLHVLPRDDPSTKPFFQYFRTKLESIGMLDCRDGLEGREVVMPKQRVKVTRFLNRLLGLPLEDQDLLFQYFNDTLDATVAALRSEGRLDAGIITIGSRGQTCKVESRQPLYQDPNSGGQVDHVFLSLDRGVSWEAAVAFKKEMEDRLEEQEPGRRHLSGFYMQRGHTTQISGRRRGYIVLATEIIRAHRNLSTPHFRIQRPNVGPADSMTLNTLSDKGYVRLPEEEAQVVWCEWYQHCLEGCYHGDACGQRRRGYDCQIGGRLSEMHLICGAVLPIWMKLQEWHRQSGHGKKGRDGKTYPLRIIKCITEGGEPIAGVEATNADELEFFRINLARTPEEEAALKAAAAAARAGPSGRLMQQQQQQRPRKKHRTKAPHTAPAAAASGGAVPKAPKQQKQFR